MIVASYGLLQVMRLDVRHGLLLRLLTRQSYRKQMTTQMPLCV
jgi:hypothetical protein